MNGTAHGAEADSVRRHLIGAARSILRPLVRQLIAHGVPFPAFSRLAKEVYIEVATRHFALPFKKQTDSRVALVTGITRKEIGQVRRAPRRVAAAERHEHALPVRAVGRWTSEPAYLGADGRPRSLPYETEGGRPSFSDLVAELGGDVSPRAVLDELVRVGAAAVSPHGDVRLRHRAYVPARDVEAKLAMLGRDAAELIGALAHNVDHPDEEAFLQRKVFYDNVGSRALPEVRRLVRERGEEFALALNRLLADFDRDRNPNAPGGDRMRAVVGVYYFEEEGPAGEETEDDEE